ncbi:ATP-binding cassette domain-containing protein [Erwiniaceae bacterium BAC15a-03b]|uniref:Cell division ATP-binding protein FtsE n=1 Tax=Winslowiella arboricola TaxID=2978220 RepID=A0A9J6PN49_9GAMM|nr:ATP-binding cassette domain-containing protein [Winslowiella arboricola]MCU5772469.1 ATP-binding cassette domain-containing protein [Winslowiella arboricola]MCU5779737.1 ATP-binding cassette domain-containing protein [Winslowiella arboricola]
MVSLPWPEVQERSAELSLAEPGPVHIAISGLYKRYAGQQVDALQNINLQIARGEIFGIIGRSGAGKSSLIRCLNRLESPGSGSVVVDGVDIGSLSSTELVVWRRGTGMIFQHFNLLSAKTVRENIDLPMRVAGIAPAQRQRKVDELLALVGLEDRQHAYPAQLSGGQKQRVGIARALVHEPKLLLCDEATSALDPETTRAILALLRDINRQQGITIVLITHEMQVIHDLCHQVAVLEQGRVIECGPVWQVYGDPQHETTQLLLNPQHNSLPEPLKNRLTAQPAAADARPLICLSYTGQGAVPQLAQLSDLLGSDITLVQSALEWVQDRQIGQLLLLTAAGQQPFQADIIPAALADRVEVLGYVTAD